MSDFELRMSIAAVVMYQEVIDLWDYSFLPSSSAYRSPAGYKLIINNKSLYSPTFLKLHTIVLKTFVLLNLIKVLKIICSLATTLVGLSVDIGLFKCTLDVLRRSLLCFARGRRTIRYN